MIKRLTRQFPVWARSDHPVLRQELGTQERLHWHVRYGRALLIVLGGALLLLIGWLAATNLFTRAAGENTVAAINAILYFPLLILQVLLRIAAFAWTSGTISEQVRRGTWDQMRATPKGAEFALRTRWISLFYRLRGLFGVITALRVFLIGLLLFDLMAFQGRYFSLLVIRITPEVSPILAIVLLSTLMTASVLLPFTGAGLDASLGLVVSSLTRGRTSVTLIQAAYGVVRIAITIVLVLAAENLLSGGVQVSDLGGWLLLFALGAIGDWSVAFLYLARLGVIWSLVPYGIFLGVGLIGFALVQSALTDLIVGYAVKLAQKRE